MLLYSLGSLLLSALSAFPVLSLLLLNPHLPLAGNLHVVVLQPDKVLSVPPVRGQHSTQLGLPSLRNIRVNVPVLLASNDQFLQPGPLDVANRRDHVFDLAQVFNFNSILRVEKLS
jgi:hypothetical protein